MPQSLWQNKGMASIEIPEDDFRRLTERAHAAGYADVSAFLSALAGEPEVHHSHKELVALIQEGLAADTVSAKEAEARIRQKMQSIEDRSK